MLKSLTNLNNFASSGAVYVMANMLVTAFVILRSFVFLSHMSFTDLGLITLLQTAAMLFGFFQLGVINGAFRKVSIVQGDEIKNVNTIVLLYLCTVITTVASIGAFNWDIVVEEALAVNTGIALIILATFLAIQNWFTNFLLAVSNLRLLNIANVSGALVSLIVAFSTYRFGVTAAIFSMALQPVIAISIILIGESRLLPRRIKVDRKELKDIFRQGFVPFLTALLYLLFLQLERWLVVIGIDQEALGQIYIYLLVVTLWQLVPTSLMGLFFPKVVRQFNDKSFQALDRTLIAHFGLSLLYVSLASVSILLLLDPIVDVMFPKHSAYTYIIHSALIGFVFKTLGESFALFFNASLQFTPMLISEVVSLLGYVGIGLYLISINEFHIDLIPLLFIAYASTKFFIRAAFFATVRRKIRM